jgi:hypothetical protein
MLDFPLSFSYFFPNFAFQRQRSLLLPIILPTSHALPFVFSILPLLLLRSLKIFKKPALTLVNIQIGT